MSFSFRSNFVPALAIVSSLASSVSASDDASNIIALSSAFEGFGWSIGGVPLGVDYVTAVQTADPSVRLIPSRWVAKKTLFSQPDIAPHDEYRSVNFGVSDYRAVSDRKIVKSTHWHTGSMAFWVERKVNSNNPDLMPTPEGLVASVTETFGNGPSADRKITGAGGITQASRDRLSYAVKNGAHHDGPCFDADMKYTKVSASITADYNAAKQIIEQIKAGDHCDGILTVSYATGQAGRLREYRIVARDFLMDAEDFVHDIDVKLKLIQEYQNNLPSVEPKL